MIKPETSFRLDKADLKLGDWTKTVKLSTCAHDQNIHSHFQNSGATHCMWKGILTINNYIGDNDDFFLPEQLLCSVWGTEQHHTGHEKTLPDQTTFLAECRMCRLAGRCFHQNIQYLWAASYILQGNHHCTLAKEVISVMVQRLSHSTLVSPKSGLRNLSCTPNPCCRPPWTHCSADGHKVHLVQNGVHKF